MSNSILTPEQKAAIPGEYAEQMAAGTRGVAAILGKKYGVSTRTIEAVITAAKRGQLGVRPGDRFTREQRGEIAREYREALDSGVVGAAAAVARKFGVPQPNLATWSPGEKPLGTAHPHPPEVRAAVVADYVARELTLQAIAAKHGVGQGCVANYARQAGVTLRGRGTNRGRPARRRRKRGKGRHIEAVESMNTALKQMNGKLPPPVPTRAPAQDHRGIIGGAVHELVRRLKLRGAKLTKLEYDGKGFSVTCEMTERFDFDDE